MDFSYFSRKFISYLSCLTHHFVDPMSGHEAPIACILNQTHAVLGRATTLDGTIGANMVQKSLQKSTNA